MDILLNQLYSAFRFLLLFAVLNFHYINGESKILYDQKYLTVGVLSNEGISQFTKNHNIRYLGTENRESLLNNGGQLMLLKLFGMDDGGKPSIQALYRQGLIESTKEEYEIADKDISATTEEILKSEGAMQLLRNNYIVILDFNRNYIKNTYKLKWEVYHVDIDEEIINQVFLNWNNPDMIRKIKVPITFVAKGKINNKNIDKLIFNISKKVAPFAIRGPILQGFPPRAYITTSQGIYSGYNVKVYQTVENEKGEMYSKIIADGRTLKANEDYTTMKIISGRYPSYKNGQIAVVTGYGGGSVSLEALYGFGPDWRVGGKFTYDRMFLYTNAGFAWYYSFGAELYQFKKDPMGVWHKTESFSDSYQPTTRSAGVFVGLNMGYSFLTKFEVLPFFNLGVAASWIYPAGNIWDSTEQKFTSVGHYDDENGFLYSPAFTWSGGVKIAFNICYPLQLLAGCYYNQFVQPKSIFSHRHEYNRFNLSLGLRYNF